MDFIIICFLFQKHGGFFLKYIQHEVEPYHQHYSNES